MITTTNREEVSEQQGYIKYLFFKRLHITIVTSGLEFYEDIRDRDMWMNAMYRKGITSTMVIEDASPDLINKIVKIMQGYGWTSQQINGFLYTLTGRKHFIKDGQMMLSTGVMA